MHWEVLVTFAADLSQMCMMVSVIVRSQLVDSYSLYSGSDSSDKDSATMYGPGGKGADKLGVGLPVRRRESLPTAHSAYLTDPQPQLSSVAHGCPVIPA